MPSPFFPSRFFAGVLGTVSVLVSIPVSACGPDFPNAYLATSTDKLAQLPTLSFAAELSRLLPPGAAPVTEVEASDPAAEAAREQSEIRAALASSGASEAEIAAALAHYDRAQPPARLPEEFQLYAAGARAWRSDRPDEAVAAWRKLLTLPAAARPYRTVWAHYMIGRALWESHGEEAGAAFQAARQAAEHGLADSQDLATASLGEEARVRLRQNDIAGALHLYFRQFAAGGPGAVASIQLTLQAQFPNGEGPEPDLARLAADRELRGVVTAWFVARGGPHSAWSMRAAQQFQRWIKALPKDERLDPAEADRWAWAAYQNGLWDEAAAFAQTAPGDAPASEWVRAMLLLRNGDIDGASVHLAGAARAFPVDPALASPQFGPAEDRLEATGEDLPVVALDGVRGVLALQREQFAEALRLFLQAGHWADAAYLAERVLTVDELVAFVRAESADSATPAQHTAAPPDVAARAASASPDLRHLLARRLTRAGQFDRAREFYPPELRATFDQYVASVRRGYREDLPARDRALALWQAAQIAKRDGMALQGTELAPDYAITGGDFEWPDIEEFRHTGGTNQGSYSRYGGSNQTGFSVLTRATSDEFDRTNRTPLPTKRFHYRQRATQLAWLASTLLPDNDDQTALILNTAGRWIAARYPEDAELFYKTLVFRCPRTELGRAALARRWLVPTTEASTTSVSPKA